MQLICTFYKGICFLCFIGIFAKGYTPNWSGEVFGIKKIKHMAPWTYVLILMVKKLLEISMKKNWKFFKRKGSKPYVK